ncbi:ABC transporter G member 31 [Ranunculus cassubicifolius]
MTVRETLEFSGRCQGVGVKYDIMELSRREKNAGIKPDEDLDIFMKILGLDVCADTVAGDDMLKGISGGAKEASNYWCVYFLSYTKNYMLLDFY